MKLNRAVLIVAIVATMSAPTFANEEAKHGGPDDYSWNFLTSGERAVRQNRFIVRCSDSGASGCPGGTAFGTREETTSRAASPSSSGQSLGESTAIGNVSEVNVTVNITNDNGGTVTVDPNAVVVNVNQDNTGTITAATEILDNEISFDSHDVATSIVDNSTTQGDNNSTFSPTANSESSGSYNFGDEVVVVPVEGNPQ